MFSERRIVGFAVVAVLMATASACGVGSPAAGVPQPDGASLSFRVMQRCPGRYVNPSYDPAKVVEGNEVSFRLRGDSTWRPGCVSRPYIVEENATSFRRIGRSIWERK